MAPEISLVSAQGVSVSSDSTGADLSGKAIFESVVNKDFSLLSQTASIGSLLFLANWYT